MLIECTTHLGEIIFVELTDLIFRQSHLCGGKLVPPRNLVIEFLAHGKVRYDHWREVSWKLSSLTNQQYDELKSELIGKYNCRISEYSNEDRGQLFWDAVQTSEQTGRPMSAVLPIIRRIEMYQRMLDVMRDASEHVEVDDDVWAEISSRLNNEVNALQ